MLEVGIDAGDVLPASGTEAVDNGSAQSRTLSATEEGRRFFAERPRIDRTHVDFDGLRKLPDGTLGREYTRFLDENGITPDAFEELPRVGDPRAAWLMLRLRQTHDLWHVLTGYRPDVDSYSAFLEADRKTKTGLTGYLNERGLRRIFFVGLATDFCVAWSALDARKGGFEALVIEDATRGIDTDGSLGKAWSDMTAAGVKRIQSADINR